jgi:hypothetical protein
MVYSENPHWAEVSDFGNFLNTNSNQPYFRVLFWGAIKEGMGLVASGLRKDRWIGQLFASGLQPVPCQTLKFVILYSALQTLWNCQEYKDIM